MHCLRCHGLMVSIRLEDAGGSSLRFSGWQCLAGGSSLRFSGWQCLMCGEVIDSVITANRKDLHGQPRSRSRPRYGVYQGKGFIS